MVSPALRRDVVKQAQELHGASERRVCNAFGFCRSTHRYQSGQDDSNSVRINFTILTRISYKALKQGE